MKRSRSRKPRWSVRPRRLQQPARRSKSSRCPRSSTPCARGALRLKAYRRRIRRSIRAGRRYGPYRHAPGDGEIHSGAAQSTKESVPCPCPSIISRCWTSPAISPARTARWSSPTMAPTWSRSNTPTVGTTCEERRRSWEARVRRSCFGTGNKRSVALDLKSAGDLATFKAMAVVADVVIESFKPGTAERLGIGCESLSASQPPARLLLDLRIRPHWPVCSAAAASTSSPAACPD